MCGHQSTGCVVNNEMELCMPEVMMRKMMKMMLQEMMKNATVERMPSQ